MLILNIKVRNRTASLLPIAIVLLLILLSHTRFFVSHNRNLSIGITLDLVFSVPLIHFVLSRRNNNLKYSTALFFTIGLIVASFIIPKNNQFLLHNIKIWVAPLIEFCGMGFFIMQARNIRLNQIALSKNSGDFYTIFRNVAKQVLPKKLASIISAELSAFYYGFFSWEKTIYNNKTFSYHKKTGTMALFGVFIFMIVIETSVFHLLLAKWSVKAAWIVTGVSLYAVLQAFGIARSLLKRPIRIIDDLLIISYGILAETTISINDIVTIESYDKQSAGSENLSCISPFKKMEEPDVILHLAKTYYIDGMYGSKKAFDKLLINVDNKDEFIEQLQSLSKNSL